MSQCNMWTPLLRITGSENSLLGMKSRMLWVLSSFLTFLLTCYVFQDVSIYYVEKERIYQIKNHFLLFYTSKSDSLLICYRREQRGLAFRADLCTVNPGVLKSHARLPSVIFRRYSSHLQNRGLQTKRSYQAQFSLKLCMPWFT